MTRFALANTEIGNWKLEIGKPEPKTEADRIILAKLDETIAGITDNLDKYIIHEAANEIYQFAWHELADVYIEASKAQLAPTESSGLQDNVLAENTRLILVWTLLNTLKLAHPFAPFVTEELWSKLFGEKPEDMLMVSRWPVVQ